MEPPRAKTSVASKVAHRVAWLRDLLSLGGSDSRGTPLKWQDAFSTQASRNRRRTRARRLTSRQNTKIESSVFVAGPVFAGVELYPEVKAHTRLVAPRATGNKELRRVSLRSAEYSLRRRLLVLAWPLGSAAIEFGSHARKSVCTVLPLHRRRWNVDGSAAEPGIYGRSKALWRNRNFLSKMSIPFPNTVSILLKIRNTAVATPSHVVAWHGGCFCARVPSRSGTATAQMLRFRIPSAIRNREL